MDLERLVIDNIRRIRKQKHISQEKLAEFCGTSASYIGLMETYKNVPKLSTIQRIAEALNVPVSLIFDEPGAQAEIPHNPVVKERIRGELLQSLEIAVDNALTLL